MPELSFSIGCLASCGFAAVNSHKVPRPDVRPVIHYEARKQAKLFVALPVMFIKANMTEDNNMSELCNSYLDFCNRLSW